MKDKLIQRGASLLKDEKKKDKFRIYLVTGPGNGIRIQIRLFFLLVRSRSGCRSFPSGSATPGINILSFRDLIIREYPSRSKIIPIFLISVWFIGAKLPFELVFFALYCTHTVSQSRGCNNFCL